VYGGTTGGAVGWAGNGASGAAGCRVRRAALGAEASNAEVDIKGYECDFKLECRINSSLQIQRRVRQK
jgi:hypothetical protein